MRTIIALTIALSLLLCSAAVVRAHGPRELTDKDYEEVTSDATKVVLVKVYADWCGHCQSLAPAYAEVAAHFETNDKVVIAKFNAPENEDYARNVLHIRSFPTIFVYEGGVQRSFEGERTKSALIQEVENALAKQQ